MAELNVVASFSILGDMTQQIGGEHVNVTTIVGADEDAHVFSPTVGDAQALASADIAFFNGLGFETWADTILAASETSATIVTVTDGLPMIIHNEEEHDEHEEHGEEGHDDHDDHHDDHDDHKDRSS